MFYKFIIRFIDCYNVTNHFYESIKFSLFFNFSRLYCIKFKNNKIFLRNNGIDEKVFNSVFTKRYHSPPIKLPKNSVIVDLGSNIGLSVIDLFFEYPNASIIIGLEMDKGNFEIAQKNVSNFKNIQLLNKAINSTNGIVFYSGVDAQSFKISKNEEINLKSIESITMDTVFEKFNLEFIDYLKIDIEGTENEIICDENSINWLSLTKIINVEIHDHLSNLKYREKIIVKLKSHNFIVGLHPSHFNALIAINKSFL